MPTVRQQNFFPFAAPVAGAGFTKTVVPTAASQSLVLDAAVIAINDERDGLLTNDSNTTVFWRSSNGADSAVLTDTPLRPGAVAIVNMGKADRVNVISTGTPTGNVYLTPGLGS